MSSAYQDQQPKDIGRNTQIPKEELPWLWRWLKQATVVSGIFLFLGPSAAGIGLLAFVVYEVYLNTGTNIRHTYCGLCDARPSGSRQCSQEGPDTATKKPGTEKGGDVS